MNEVKILIIKGKDQRSDDKSLAESRAKIVAYLIPGRIIGVLIRDVTISTIY